MPHPLRRAQDDVPGATRSPARRTHAVRAAPLRFGTLVCGLLVAIGLAVAPLASGLDEAAATADFIRSHYTKTEVRIPMRDGVKLFTAIYTPNDGGPRATYPILLNRTPYSVAPYGADRYKTALGPTAAYAEERFIFVYQDVRGKFLSEGEFVNMRPQQTGPGGVDESTDAWDTIDWLVKNIRGHNGKVGLWGISYPGFYAAAGAINSHPALAAVSPQAPIADWFWDDMHHHGAFILPLTFNFLSTFGQPRSGPSDRWGDTFDHGTSDGYDFFLDLGPLSNANERYFHGDIDFWNQIATHPNYDDFWQSRNLLPHLDGVSAAVMTVGGWYDAEDLYGPLKTYRSLEEKNPGIFNILVMGPWPHGGWTRGDGRALGDADFGFATGEWYVEHVELPFFRHFLKGEGGQGKGGSAKKAGAAEAGLPEALMFETGPDRWRRFDQWPPAETSAADLYLHADGGLAFEAPSGVNGGTADATAAAADPGHDAYVSDPDRPVPYTPEITTRWERTYMTEDQRFVANRPDVLVYQTEPLTEAVTLAGPVTADLWVSTSGGDSDWIVKLIDVQPTDEPGFKPWKPREERVREEEEKGAEWRARGAQLLIRGEVFRGRFRESYEAPKPFTPNEPTKVTFELQDVLHTFQPGHRIMVQIHSTWFPLVDRNPGTWVDNIFEATEEDFVPVTNRVYHSTDHPSRLRVGVLGDQR